jgi:hypothetical protein
MRGNYERVESIIAEVTGHTLLEDTMILPHIKSKRAIAMLDNYSCADSLKTYMYECTKAKCENMG